MKFTGFAFLAAGLAFVFHAYSPSRFDHSVPPPAHEADHVAPDLPIKLTRNFSVGPVAAVTQVTDQPEVKPLIAPVQLQPALTLPRAVDLTPGANAAALPVQPVVAEDAPPSRSGVVQRIQRELRRVGCYGGRIDGEWDRTSRAAMDAFMERVNATIPSREPDVVLLNLVRNHKAVACGACPSGQSMDGDGKCLPNAIIAKLKRGKAPATAVASRTVTTPFTTTVAINEVRPTAAILPPPKEPRAQAANRAPPPGRMAMGGPASQTTAKAVPAEKSWWDHFIGPVTAPAAEPAQQTLDRPVGLTHVPEPRVVRQVQLPAGPSPNGAAVGVAALDGSSDGTALQANGNALAVVTPAPPKARSGRSYKKAGRSQGRQKYARRWSGRNVQAMFQHPLGRM